MAIRKGLKIIKLGIHRKLLEELRLLVTIIIQVLTQISLEKWKIK